MARLIGVDVGPTEVTVLAVDADDGEVLARVQEPLVEPGRDAWPEWTAVANPDAVFAATTRALHTLVAEFERAHDVRGIGLCGWPGVVRLDEARQPTGLESAAHAVPIKDYVGMRLTGVLATDLTEDPTSLPHPLGELAWPAEGRSETLRGALIEDVARTVHLSDGIPVVRGATRRVAAAVGMGCTHASVAAAWLEQDGWLALSGRGGKPSDVPQGVSVLRHALADQHCVLAKAEGVGAMLDWYGDVLCDGERMAAELRSTSVREIVLEAASTSRPGGGGVLFAGQSLVGLNANTTKADVSRALLEGAAFSLRRTLQAARATLPDAEAAPVEQVRLVGPWAKSAFFRQLLADVLEVEVAAASPDAAALGAAALGAVGARLSPTLEQTAEAWVHPNPKGRARPETVTAARYRDVAAVYDGLCEALGEPLARLADLP